MRRDLAPLLATALLTAAALPAQQPQGRFRATVGLAGGSYGFDSELAGFDDRGDAGMLQLAAEGTTSAGIGGGLRLELAATDDADGLFRSSAADTGTEARNLNVFGHFTYRIEQHRFAMPVRVGLMCNSLRLDDRDGGRPDHDYLSLGPAFEIEPELTLLRRRPLRWSIYGLLGLGAGATTIDVEGDPRDYESSTACFAIEAGTRLCLDHAEFGLAYIGRFRSMARSTFERYGSSYDYVQGYDDDFQGLLLTFGVRF